MNRLKVKPLWRVDFVQADDHQVQCIFTIHHILMDGLEYRCATQRFVRLVPRSFYCTSQGEFSDYLAWIQNQDNHQSNDYWQRYLQDMESPTRLAGSSDNQSSEMPDSDCLVSIDTMMIIHKEILK